MKKRIAKILTIIILATSTLMFLPWFYMTNIYYIARYVLMALTVVTLGLTFSLSDVLSVRFVRLLILTIACMLLFKIFLPILFNDILQLGISLITVLIGIGLSFTAKDWSKILFYYTLCVCIVTICNCLVFAGNLKIPEYYMVNESKNQIGAMLAIGSIVCYYFGIKIKEQRISLWSVAFLALLCIILIRARSDFFALILVGLLITLKDLKLYFKPSIKNILTVLIIAMSAVILYTGFIGDDMHTFMFGGKNNSTFNEITSHRWIRNQQGMDILKHQNSFEEIRNIPKIPFIHNYPLLHTVRYGFFSLPLIAFYIYFVFSTLFEFFRRRKSNIEQVGWISCAIPLIISLAEPNFPYGPGLVQLPAFLLLGYSLQTHKVLCETVLKKRKILHICNDFNNSKVHTNLYRELDKYDLEQTVFVPMRKKLPENNSFESKKTEFIYAHILKPIHRLFFFHKIEKTVREIEKRVDLKNVSICHATTTFSDGMVALKLNKKYGIPYIVAVRNSDINAFIRYMPHLWWCHRAVLKNAQKVIFMTPSLKNRLSNHFTLFGLKYNILGKAEIIPNGIDSYWIYNQIRKNKITSNNRILYAGNLSRNKNVLRLIDAILKLRKDIPNLHLDIVGDGGADEKRVYTAAKRNPETITCHQRITEPEKMQKMYENNDIFAMPSKSETFGLVYIEALSQGLPVIWSRGEAIDGMFDKKIGESINPLSVDDICTKLSKILNSYQEYTSLSTDEIKQFSWSKIAPEYISLYNTITNTQL